MSRENWIEPHTQDEELATIISNYFDGSVTEADIDTLTDTIVENGYRKFEDVAKEIFTGLKAIWEEGRGFISYGKLVRLERLYTERNN